MNPSLGFTIERFPLTCSTASSSDIVYSFIVYAITCRGCGEWCKVWGMGVGCVCVCGVWCVDVLTVAADLLMPILQWTNTFLPDNLRNRRQEFEKLHYYTVNVSVLTNTRIPTTTTKHAQTVSVNIRTGPLLLTLLL